MNTAAAEGEYARAKTSVWWDIENCQVPKGWDANEIAQKLNSELMKMNYYGPLSISSYGNTDLIPDSVQQALSSTGISLNHVPSGRKDASDKKILVDMFLWVLDNPPPANVMLISGDGDFSYALHRLRMMRYNIILAHTQEAPATLVSSAKTTWLWRGLLASGCLLTHCGSEASSNVVSEPMDSGSGTSSVAVDKPKGVYAPEASNQQKTKRKRSRKVYNSAWFCKLCNVTCPNLETSTTHISSKEHLAQRKLKKNLELLCETENMVAVAPSECCEKDSETTTNMVVEASVHCGSCSVVKKQTEAMQCSVNAKNVEESVKDNDLQCRDTEESMKCLEKQNKEPMETSTTSERSGREFWTDFKEKLESYGVDPSYVDCVFGEVSRDCQVPKEVSGECFDAVLKKPKSSENKIVMEKLEEMLKQGLEMTSGEPEERTENLEEDVNKNKKKKNRKKKNGELTEDGAEPYFCGLCNVICHRPDDFESHLNGRKHTAKIKRHIEALLDDKQIQKGIIQEIDQPKEMTKEVLLQPRDALENIDGLEKQNNEMRGICAISGKSVEELFQNFQQVLESENKSRPNEECIFTELNPERYHLTRNVTQANGNLEMNSGNTVSNSAGATEPPEEYMDKKKKDNVTKEEAYACSICGVKCHNQIVLESHLMGRKHVNRVKRLAEVRSMLQL